MSLPITLAQNEGSANGKQGREINNADRSTMHANGTGQVTDISYKDGSKRAFAYNGNDAVKEATRKDGVWRKVDDDKLSLHGEDEKGKGGIACNISVSQDGKVSINYDQVPLGKLKVPADSTTTYNADSYSISANQIEKSWIRCKSDILWPSVPVAIGGYTMLLKWIMCRVSEQLRVPFSASQSKWRQLSKVPGFLGQFGGWNLKSNEEACIVAMWQDESHYRQFMKQQHDKIVRHNDQMNTYDSIDVSLLTPTYEMPGRRESMVDSLQEACALRIADCFVKPEREAHFVEMQHEIWIPSMCKAEGMLAGVFSKVDHEPSRYMVTTLWESVEAHDAYSEKILPSLRRESKVAEDVAQIVGGFVPLNQDWLVLPIKSSNSISRI